MAAVTQQYVDSLPPIYRDVLAAFPEISPTRNAGEGLTFQTLFTRLRRMGRGESVSGHGGADRKRPWSYEEIKEACHNMEKGGAVKIEIGMFACPTEVGEEIIALLNEGKRAPKLEVPPFPPLVGYSEVGVENAQGDVSDLAKGEDFEPHGPAAQ